VTLYSLDGSYILTIFMLDKVFIPNIEILFIMFIILEITRKKNGNLYNSVIQNTYN